MSHLISKYEPISKVEIPKKISKKNRIVSKGSLNIFEGKNLDKFVQVTVKGLNIYYYDFGIAYPKNTVEYPIFIYQIISAPKRILVVINYAFNKKDDVDKIIGLNDLLELDSKYADMLIKSFEPQEFLVEDIIPNSFNGLIRTTEVDKAYERVFNLFQAWYEGMELNVDLKNKDMVKFDQWLTEFKNKFYTQDYGFAATKRFLGEKWAKEVFETYVFD